jgi:hypothetical protein
MPVPSPDHSPVAGFHAAMLSLLKSNEPATTSKGGRGPGPSESQFTIALRPADIFVSRLTGNH